MSLWTPAGEHPVGDEGRTRDPGGPPRGAPPPDVEASDDSGSVEDLRRQLADAPAEVVVVNHCYGLFELAAVYLSQSPPRFEQAQLAIDALGHLVEGLGERLAEAHAPLRDALAQVRLAYVQLQAAEQQRMAEPQRTGDGRD